MESLFNKFPSLRACNFIKEKLREANQWISFDMVGTSVMTELIIPNHWDGSISQIWIKPNDSIFTTTQLLWIFQKAYLSSIVSNSFWRSTDIIPINSFHTTSLFLYPLKTDVFRGYRKRPVEWNRLINHYQRLSRFYHSRMKDKN